MKIRFAAISLLVICIISLPTALLAQGEDVLGSDVEIISGEQAYQSYLVAPTSGGAYPAIILIHSFRRAGRRLPNDDRPTCGGRLRRVSHWLANL